MRTKQPFHANLVTAAMTAHHQFIASEILQSQRMAGKRAETAEFEVVGECLLWAVGHDAVCAYSQIWPMPRFHGHLHERSFRALAETP